MNFMKNSHVVYYDIFYWLGVMSNYGLIKENIWKKEWEMKDAIFTDWYSGTLCSDNSDTDKYI